MLAERSILCLIASCLLNLACFSFLNDCSASYSGLQDWKLAAEDAKECIRLDPTFIKGYYRLSSAQIELKQYDAATATIRQGLTLEANNAQLLKQMRIIKQLQKVEAAKLASPKASNHGGLDEAATRELQELQVQYGQTNREFGTVQANLNMTQREYKMADLTKTELDEVPEGTKCYRSIGKMFMMSTQESVLGHLDKQMNDNKKKESEMTQKMEYLERRMKSQRQNIEELMSPS
jgi:chaperonin cofactor prefoldin